MSEVVESNKKLDVTAACAYLGVKSGVIYRAIYKNWLSAEKCDENGTAKYYFTFADLDAYYEAHLKNPRTLGAQRRTSQTRHTAPLQSLDPLESEEAEEEPSPFAVSSFIEEDPEPVEEGNASEAQPSMPEVSPEIAMLSLVLSQIRRKVAREERGAFIERLRAIRDVLMATHAMILTSIDNTIAEYEASDDDTSSQ